VKAINELKPVLGLELTATPFVEGPEGAGAVQERDPRLPARQRPWRMDLSRNLPSSRARTSIQSGMSPEAIERLKLEDGVRMHERRRWSWRPTPARASNAHREALSFW
jgi:type III restriction enzyme